MNKYVIGVGLFFLFSFSLKAQSEKEEAYTHLVNKYFEYYEQQKPDSAEMVLHQAIELMPDAEINFMMRGNLAELMVARGDTLGALEQLSLALGQQSEIIQLRSRRAQLFEESNRLNDALMDLDYLIDQEPKMEVPLYNRARVRQKLGLLEGAQRDLEKIIELNDEAYLPRIALAKVMVLRKDYLGAEKVLTYLIDNYPKLPNAYRERAKLFILQDRKAQALEDIRYVFNELKRSTSEDFRIRGEIWQLYGEKEQAKKDFKRAEEIEINTK